MSHIVGDADARSCHPTGTFSFPWRGPRPLLDDPAHAELLLTYALIRHRLDALPRPPSALLFISAHWEATELTLTAAAQPSLLFDYYGFPPQSYQLRYPVVGAPALAASLAEQLGTWGWTAHLDSERCLLNWKQALGAAFCHPREEHLLPIHVCAAAAGKPVTQEWRFTALNRHGSCYWWD